MSQNWVLHMPSCTLKKINFFFEFWPWVVFPCQACQFSSLGALHNQCKRYVIFAQQQNDMSFLFVHVACFFARLDKDPWGPTRLKLPFSTTIFNNPELDLLQIQFPMVLCHWFGLKLSVNFLKFQASFNFPALKHFIYRSNQCHKTH